MNYFRSQYSNCVIWQKSASLKFSVFSLRPSKLNEMRIGRLFLCINHQIIFSISISESVSPPFQGPSVLTTKHEMSVYRINKKQFWQENQTVFFDKKAALYALKVSLLCTFKVASEAGDGSTWICMIKISCGVLIQQ